MKLDTIFEKKPFKSRQKMFDFCEAIFDCEIATFEDTLPLVTIFDKDGNPKVYNACFVMGWYLEEVPYL